MVDIDIPTLHKVAEAAVGGRTVVETSGYFGKGGREVRVSGAYLTFQEHADPPTVLALLDELEALRTMHPLMQEMMNDMEFKRAITGNSELIITRRNPPDLVAENAKLRAELTQATLTRIEEMKRSAGVENYLNAEYDRLTTELETARDRIEDLESIAS